MLLHTLNARSPHAAFRDCLRSASQGDTIVLLGEGVYNALPGSEPRDALDNSPARVLALDSDVRAAGLQQILEGVVQVDMDGLVALSEYYPRQLAWY